MTTCSLRAAAQYPACSRSTAWATFQWNFINILSLTRWDTLQIVSLW